MNLYQDLTNAINTGSVKLIKGTSDEFVAINQDGRDVLAMLGRYGYVISWLDSDGAEAAIDVAMLRSEYL